MLVPPTKTERNVTAAPRETSMSFRAHQDAPAAAGSEQDEQTEVDALVLDALEDATSLRHETAAHDALPHPVRRPLRRTGSSATASGSEGDVEAGSASGHQTTRLLEALEALSSETGGAMPPSLRSLLGQLQGDDADMAGLFPFMQLLESHGSHPRFHRMLQSIDADAPVHSQLSGLSDLCESLSMSSEESLVVSGFSVDKFLPPVIQLIRAPPTMEVLLMAARALSSMFDLFPTVAIPKAMADNSLLVDSICAKLLEIEYMDVAELAFQILERIVFCPQSESTSTSFRRVVISANGFVALLQFVDFFPIEIQRTAARVVAGLCTNIGIESLEELRLALPLIAGLLRSSDSEIVQQGCKSFQLLSASPTFVANEEFAQLAANEDTCDSLATLMESFAEREGNSAGAQSTPVSIPSCVNALQFMSAVLSTPHRTLEEQATLLRFTRLPPTLAMLLATQAVTDDVSLLREILKLVIAVLPPAQIIGQHGFKDEHHTIREFLRAIMPRVIHVYEVCGRAEVRNDCLGVILRVCLLQQHFEPTDEDFAELAHLSSFLAHVLRPEGVSENMTNLLGRNSRVALQIAQVCLHSGSAFSKHAKSLFARHGVSTAIRHYANEDAANEGEGIGALSRLLVSEYLGEEDSRSEPSMEKLREIVRLLEASLNDSKEDQSDRHSGLTRGLCDLLVLSQERRTSSSAFEVWLTAHEISSSGLSASLNRVLQDTGGRRIFGETFMSDPDNSDSAAFVAGLIASVQDAVSAEKDSFRVDAFLMGSSAPVSSGSVSNDMDQLTQHIKVRVKIDDSESATVSPDVKRNKRSVHDTVVLVEPLARIDTIEEFIAERLFGSRSPFGAMVEDDDDDQTGPRRRRARRGGNDTEEKHDDDERDGENEDHDEEHDDENDDLRSDRPQKQKRLQVSFGGVVMRGESSVLEAILKTRPTASTESHSGELAKAWTGSPHEFVFRVLDKDQGKALACAEHGASSSALAPLELPACVKDSLPELRNDVWSLLDILKYLHELRGDSKGNEFVNPYISLQVTRALTQPVRVMTNSLPPWVFRVVDNYPFVLEYETRFDFLFTITSGAPRAISYLCRTLWKKAALAEEPQLGSIGGREIGRSHRSGRERNGGRRNATTALMSLSRMAKLPRLKVRVARSRLLQSAMKLFSMYGGKKAIIEIEFLGEVGTGLGPTTEFYTLVCHELQASHLKLWRNDKDVATEEDEQGLDESRSSEFKKHKTKKESADMTKKPGLPIRGYHRVALYHCTSCKHLEVPRCAIHDQLLTYEKSADDGDGATSASSIPQCAKCLDTHDWHSAYATCKSCFGGLKKDGLSSDVVATPAASDDGLESLVESTSTSSKYQYDLKWWILSEEETVYLQKVYPRDVESIKHPVLQCSHCDTVNFPGTDAGIVVLDHTGERMMSRAGRRMYERDYRAVTKHVSPLCEGTPLKQIGVVLTRDAVDTLVDCIKKSPELLDSDVESLCYMSEVGVQHDVDVVDAPFGLFPKPYLPRSTELEKPMSQGVLSWFNFMGRFVAQAILDERLVNLPLSRAFLRALRREVLVAPDVDMARSLEYVEEVDPSIARSLRYLNALASEAASESDVRMLETKAHDVEAMGLAFTLVGDASIPLCDDGKNVPVTLANVGEYVRLNVQFLLDETIQHHVAAFYEGFATISGCADTRRFLQSFSLRELEFLLADKSLAGDSMWDREGKELREHMVCDHGYTPHSRAIQDLVAILCDLPLEEQRLFVKFVTGANRLPLGGLAKLEPKLTVVRKLAVVSSSDDHGDAASSTDAVLPSASTCTNYLKLPEYSTREAMQRRLAYCIYEGQGSFHLS